jgi:hypothetical protein
MPRIDRSIKTGSRFVPRGGRAGGGAWGSGAPNEYQIFKDGKSLLKVILVMVTQLCGHTKTFELYTNSG